MGKGQGSGSGEGRVGPARVKRDALLCLHYDACAAQNMATMSNDKRLNQQGPAFFPVRRRGSGAELPILRRHTITSLPLSYLAPLGPSASRLLASDFWLRPRPPSLGHMDILNKRVGVHGRAGPRPTVRLTRPCVATSGREGCGRGHATVRCRMAAAGGEREPPALVGRTTVAHCAPYLSASRTKRSWAEVAISCRSASQHMPARVMP